ncbi:MAG: hypothetical protein LBD19_01875 [Endomicrobium sp.]|jgi:energy-coupling factor transporter ATP-binding protein EcfA2|nr:hypothetical protein [Endomicrobium sp.]
MPIKIEHLTISGIRGIQTPINIPLNKKSILLYGENGSGKSSITDAIEWLYKDKVEHLSIEGVDHKEALRNLHIGNDVNSEISIRYTNGFNLSKKLTYKNKKLISELSDTASEYLSASTKENSFTRYYLLRNFVSQTKTKKLEFLSDIIGFSEVTKTKEIFKKAHSSIKSESKTQNFDNQISIQKKMLISKIGAAVSQEKDFIGKINEIIKPLYLQTKVNEIKDIDTILEQIKQSAEKEKLLEILSFLETISNLFTSFKNEVNSINNTYKAFLNEFNKIATDTKSIMQIFLRECLQAGKAVIEENYHKDNSCPLCLQPKKLEDLRVELKQRLEEINSSLQIRDSFDKAKKSVADLSTERIRRIDAVLDNQIISEPENSEIKTALENIKIKFQKYYETTEKKVIVGDTLPSSESLLIIAEDFQICVEIEKKLDKINAVKKNNKTMEIYANISSARDAFLQIKRFENEKERLEHQKKSLELIFNEFIKQQKEGLENFINNFSSSINEFYSYMNPNEAFQDIRITTIGEEDELKGLTVEYKYNNELVSPPQKYFSEAHLNCFGIAFFLASVFAFNKENKFIVLDDIISSFDTNHRKKFADLIFEKFSEYQIILLTHETEWFKYMSDIAKKKGWLINTIKWSETKGAYLDEPLYDIEESIEHKLADGSVEGLGNEMRQYLEHILKNICSDLEAQVKFSFNDKNEKRMSDELLNSLKSKIKNKGKSSWTEQIKIIDNVANSNILGNLLSHDNTFNPKLGDLKAFWKDIKNFQKIFTCQDTDCKKPNLSIKKSDVAAES